MSSREGKKPVHVVGIKGIPGGYGGFETLAQQLVESSTFSDDEFVVYCEKGFLGHAVDSYLNARLISLSWRATGWQSIVYDFVGIFKASRAGGVVLILGTSATIFLPIFQLLFPSTKYVVNMAGLEWSREKWGRVAKAWLKVNERAAAFWSDVLVADNRELKKYVRKEYGVTAVFIPYGGDQSLSFDAKDNVGIVETLPPIFDLAVARAQVDNNLTMILDAYVESGDNLVFLSNWTANQFAVSVEEKYRRYPNLYLLEGIYDQETLLEIKGRARIYVHGHSAGGTNPVLVEMMNYGLPVFAFDVCFNRSTTEDKASYFRSKGELRLKLAHLDESELKKNGEIMKKVASDNYRWREIADQYKAILAR